MKWRGRSNSTATVSLGHTLQIAQLKQYWGRHLCWYIITVHIPFLQNALWQQIYSIGAVVPYLNVLSPISRCILAHAAFQLASVRITFTPEKANMTLLLGMQAAGIRISGSYRGADKPSILPGKI